MNSYIIQGEYWRFFTPIFFHGGLPHLLVNCYSLYMLGLLTERIYGRAKFIFSYLVAGILGNIISFMFVGGYSVGASGAIFGLMGMLLYYGIEKPAQFKLYFGRGIISTIAINLIYGFTVSGIDNCAHLGGLVGGFLAIGMISRSEGKAWYNHAILYFVVLLAITVGGLNYGFHNENSQITREIMVLEQLEEKGDWAQLEAKGKEVFEMHPKNENDQVSVLWSITKAQIMQGKNNDALTYGKELAALSPANGHYLLGITYYNMGQYSLAAGELKLAQVAGNQAASQMLQELSQYDLENQS